VSRRLPPFLSLRTLEAAARLKSYSLAAQELHVTHGAVSQQIRKLEEELGEALFTRIGARMQPTEAAEALAETVRDAMRMLGEGIDAFHARDGAQRLVITCFSNFAHRVVAPALFRFAEIAPDIRVELRAEDRVVDFTREDVDLGIRFGNSTREGLEALRIADERMFPICSPDFLQRHPVNSVEALLKLPLLHHTDERWAAFAQSLGLPAPESRGPSFDDSTMIIEAAVRGHGVGLVPGRYALADLIDGRLVRPCEEEMHMHIGYFLVWRADSPKRAAIERFRDWFMADINSTHDPYGWRKVLG
jgi:LysR family transcriptional regulator, glycine cleavage system transcriptional activator